ncbi:MFS transporter [Segetibacter sp. 3557_3]|uniref:MFS transporter n=1 Tax=Segetibacter sp. 3557_3 TaxID=2547429 RepID=UPI0010590285|nr:MFS transporter [Segetibacter sp. 3557_3]TDH19946.1 MFS transporter [Segetibacter sp. 3557_3]
MQIQETAVAAPSGKDMKLFYACFVALVTTAFGFITRAVVLPQWGVEFNLTQTQLGEIAGVGLWPFAISIVLFSLIIDKIGYKTAMIFAFVCHLSAAIITIFADGYWMLYIGTFIVAIGNGTVEAVTNPVVATMFPRAKVKWLSILHAGWAGGLVLGGVMALLLGEETKWEYKIALIILPTLIYAIMMIPRKFPVNERVKAGVSYKEMLQEVGAGGALIIVGLIVFQLGAVFGWPLAANIVLTLLITGFFWMYTKSFGQPLFVLLLLIMIPLATTELGTDSWISDLMSPEMGKLGLQGGWVLVYTSAIMFVLRFFAGDIAHKISPLGLLATCSAIAAIGLYMMSFSSGVMILLAATIYGLGKTFFWPTMLALVSERFPKGGALTLNITGGLGMIAAGVIGAGILGFIQDKSVDSKIADYDSQNNTAIHSTYVTEKKTSLFGDYGGLDQNKLATASDADKETVVTIRETAKKEALRYIVIFPLIMLVSYLALMAYFKSRGGYKPIVLEEEAPATPY